MISAAWDADPYGCPTKLGDFTPRSIGKTDADKRDTSSKHRGLRKHDWVLGMFNERRESV